MRKTIFLLWLLTLAGSLCAQTSIVFHAVNCKVTPSENHCIGCTDPFVPVSTYTCDAYVTGGSGTLWPSQSAPAKLFSLFPIPTDGTLPTGLSIDPKVGLAITPNPVGCHLGCGTNQPNPPTNLQILVSQKGAL